jgi:hypothetical protein
MPEPFAKPEAPTPDKVVETLERGSRARQLLQLGVGDDLEKRRRGIWFIAEQELLAGKLSPDRALMHIACSNALRAYLAELTRDIEAAQRVAEQVHAEPEEETETPVA